MKEILPFHSDAENWCWCDQHAEERKYRKDGRWDYHCSGCRGHFATKQALREHLDSHLFECAFPKCGQTFSHEWELRMHQRSCPWRVATAAFDCYKIYRLIGSTPSQTYYQSGWEQVRPRRAVSSWMDKFKIYNLEKYPFEEIYRPRTISVIGTV